MKYIVFMTETRCNGSITWKTSGEDGIVYQNTKDASRAFYKLCISDTFNDREIRVTENLVITEDGKIGSIILRQVHNYRSFKI